MCANCLSSLDFLALNGLGAAAVGSEVWRRLRDGRTAVERRAVAWDANAAFLESMGHEAVSLLGPRPTAHG